MLNAPLPSQASTCGAGISSLNQPQKVEFLHCLVGPVNCGLDMQAVDLYVIQVGKGSFPQHTVENSHIAEVTLSPRSNSQEAIL